MIDLDPQCNLTICGIQEDYLEHIWEEEDPFIDDFGSAKKWQMKKPSERLMEVLEVFTIFLKLRKMVLMILKFRNCHLL